MANPTGIIITKADLDEDDRGIIVTGFIAPESLNLLQADAYQREELSEQKILVLMDALRTSRVPTVELGMRGNEDCVEMRDDDTFVLLAPTYVVEGFQRTTAGQRLIAADPLANPRIQVTVHLNTTFDWERKRFEVLNAGQTKVNGNIMLRNHRYDFEAVEMLVKLTESPSFVLYSRVGWAQNKHRGDLISALTLAKTVGMLHSHLGPGRNNNTDRIAAGLQKIMENVGKGTMQRNIKLFFSTVNSIWSIETVAYKNTAVQLKEGFLLALAKVFTNHTNFWDGNKLVIDRPTILKLGTFPMNDTTVTSLANGSNGLASDYLAQLLADHINKGRRTNRLVRRNYVGEVELDEATESREDVNA